MSVADRGAGLRVGGIAGGGPKHQLSYLSCVVIHCALTGDQ